MVVALLFMSVTAASVVGVLIPGMATPTAKAAKPNAKSLVSCIAAGRRRKAEAEVRRQKSKGKKKKAKGRTEELMLKSRKKEGRRTKDGVGNSGGSWVLRNLARKERRVRILFVAGTARQFLS